MRLFGIWGRFRKSTQTGAGASDLAAFVKFVPADATITLRKIDSVTAMTLASFPEDILPEGITHAAVLSEALTSGQLIFDASGKIELRCNSVSSIPTGSRDHRGRLWLQELLAKY